MEGKKAEIFLIYNVLKKYSDDHNPLTYQEIIDKIYQDYHLKFERKSIAANISLLNELDYEIIKSDNGKKGWYLNTRLFEPSEVNYLTDAIFSSKAISGKYATDLCEKIRGELSLPYQKNIKHLYKCPTVDRSDNRQFFNNIDNITKAIRHNKQIRFKYMTYDENLNLKPRISSTGSEIYVASPICMAYSRGYCYVLTIYNRYGKKATQISPFRIDYMQDVETTNENRVRPEDVLLKYKNKKFEITDYINTHIYMFGSDELVTVKLKAKNKDAYKYVKEWFGHHASTYKNEKGETIIKVLSDEQTFYFWIMQYSEHFTLLEPKSLVKKVKETAKKILEEY